MIKVSAHIMRAHTERIAAMSFSGIRIIAGWIMNVRAQYDKFFGVI